MPESASIIEPFVNKDVSIKTRELTVQGRLVGVDPGLHGTIGNVILKQGETLTIVRGEHVQVIFRHPPPLMCYQRGNVVGNNEAA